MKTTRKTHGKISEHFAGLGAPSDDEVTQRARELALINGRPSNLFSQDDLAQAKRELMGVDGDGEPDQTEELTKWDENPQEAGRPVEKIEATDEQTVAEELVEEGVHEAEHDQMVEGHKDTRLY